MTRKKRKAAKGNKTAADIISSDTTGDTKMETMKSSETKQKPSKAKTNGSRAAKPKSGRLAVTDLRADTFVMTRKKTEKTVASVAKSPAPEIRRSGKSAAKASVSPSDWPKATTKSEKTATPGKTGPKKTYIKSGRSCKVTFRLPKAAAPEARMVTVVGDFNNWNVTETKMKKLKNGDFTTTLELPCNREYRFRYLIDANRWENDWFADKYIPNRYGSDDSVVVIEGNGSS
jgi:hypothetical protein